MNEQNATGINLEKYNGEEKPTQDIRRKIANFVIEYRETRDKQHARNSFREICGETKIHPYSFVNQLLHTAYAQD